MCYTRLALDFKLPPSGKVQLGHSFNVVLAVEQGDFDDPVRDPFRFRMSDIFRPRAAWLATDFFISENSGKASLIVCCGTPVWVTVSTCVHPEIPTMSTGVFASVAVDEFYARLFT